MMRSHQRANAKPARFLGWNGKSSGMMRCFASKGVSLQA